MQLVTIEKLTAENAKLKNALKYFFVKYIGTVSEKATFAVAFNDIVGGLTPDACSYCASCTLSGDAAASDEDMDDDLFCGTDRCFAEIQRLLDYDQAAKLAYQWTKDDEYNEIVMSILKGGDLVAAVCNNETSEGE